MSLVLADALALVHAAMQHAEAHGLRISCCVVDANGHELAGVRMDKASWFTLAVARSKARSAAAVRADAAAMEPVKAQYPELFDIINAELPFTFTTLLGGIAVKRERDFLGAIGVSGATPEQDLEVARAAVEQWLAA